MIEALLSSHAYTTRWIVDAVADIAERDRARLFPGIANHPAWTLGHLIFSAQSIGGELEVAPWLDASWQARFGQGSVPIDDADAYPPLAFLVVDLRACAKQLQAHLAARGADFLAQPLPDVRFRALLPTRGHAALQVLVGHTAFHAGQLAVGRRAAGLPGRSFV